MVVSAWLVWREYGRGARFPLFIFYAQLALNLAWSGIFFGSRMPGMAFIATVILWLAVAFNIFIFHIFMPVAALLLAPYIVWVTFTGYLNFALWRLNRS